MAETVQSSSNFSFNVDSTSQELLTLSNAYLKMLQYLNGILQNCNLSSLKLVLYHQVCTPKGIRLKSRLKKQILDKIAAATSSQDLINVLDDFPFCNWLDIRLVEALSKGSESKSASGLITAYEEFLSQKKLCDVLNEFETFQSAKIEAYVAEVHQRIVVDSNKMTVNDFIYKMNAIVHIILGFVKPKLCVRHVRKGRCLEITYFMPEHCSYDMYKAALLNRHKFYSVNLVHIKIGDHPPIYDPCLSNLSNYSVQEVLYSEEEVLRKVTNILLDNVPVENIVELCSSFQLLTDDILAVISFVPSEYLKNHVLSKCLQNLKLPKWLKMCDVLQDAELTKHVGAQIKHTLKDKSLNLVQNAENIIPEANLNVAYTGSKKFKRSEFFHGTTRFGKSQTCTYWLKSPSLDLCPLQYVKCINPSDVDKEFYYLSGHVIELLNCCHPELLIKWCENLMAFEDCDCKLLPRYFVFRLRQLKSSLAILKMMSLFWSWSNHSVLKCLAGFSEVATALLEEFDSRLYLNSLITKYPIPLPDPSMIPHNNSSFTVLTLKCNRKLQVTLQEVYDIQSMIIEKCEITQHALQLLAVQSSPLMLQWMTSKYVVEFINCNLRKHRKYFASKGFTEILIHPNMMHCFDGGINKDSILLTKERYDLCDAAMSGNEAVVKELIQLGVDLDVFSADGYSALDLAIWSGSKIIVDLLIAAGANVNYIDYRDHMPLHQASCYGNDKLVEVFIAAGADVNYADYFKQSPLHEASQYGYYKVVELLIAAGADLHFSDYIEQTPLHSASAYGKDKTAELLIKAGSSVNAVDKNKATPLHDTSSVEAAKVLIKYGANIHAVDKAGNTPLHTASLYNREEVVEVLIAAGANVNCVNNVGNAPLHIASLHGLDKVLKVLIAAGADMDCAHKTPLHVASQKNQVQIAELLIKSGANVNAVDKIKQTPLHKASQIEVTKLLIRSGANIDAVDKGGKSPLHVASYKGHDKVVEILITAGADMNCVDNAKKTPLHKASNMGHIKVVELFIKSGANLDAVDKLGNTPIDLAIRKHRLKVVDALLKSKVHISIDAEKILKQISDSKKKQCRGSKHPVALSTKSSHLFFYNKPVTSSSEIMESKEAVSTEIVKKSSLPCQPEDPITSEIKSPQSMTELSGIVTEDLEVTDRLQLPTIFEEDNQ